MLTNYLSYFDEIYITLREMEKEEFSGSYCKNIIRYLENHKSKINDWLRYYNFSTEEEEILFFKFIKPRLCSKIIYFKMLQDMYLQLPKSRKSVYKFYAKMLEKNSEIPNNLKSFSRYIRNESTHRDQEYFLRKNNVTGINNQYYFFFFDERITSKMEFSLATLLAKEQIIIYLENKLQEMEEQIVPIIPNSKLKWTGTNLDMIELIYALHHNKVVNDGKKEVKEIAKALGKIFDIDVEENLYRYYIDLKRRKKDKARFLFSMTETLIRHLEE